MGNNNATSSASTSTNIDPFIQVIGHGYNILKCANEHVSQEQFERLFNCFSHEQSMTLWSQLFPRATAVDLETYAESVRSLESIRNDRDRIRFVLSLVDKSKTNDTEEIPYINDFFRWCAAVNAFTDEDVSQVVKTIIPNFLPLEEERFPTTDLFGRWCVRNCSEIAHDLCSCITESLRCGRLIAPLSEKLKNALKESSLQPSTMWLLSNSITEKYKYNRLREGDRMLDKFNLEKMSHMHRLFDSHEHGLSSSRLKNLVFDYDAPTLTFIEFPEQSYCLVLDSPYKEEWTPIGDSGTTLFSIRPKFCKLLSGEKIVYCNFSSKSGKRSIGVGRNPIDDPIVECDEGLSTGSVFRMKKKVVRFEVWGCGGDSATLLRKQAEIKEWEKREALRQRDRKIKGEAWEDSPDRVIMQWGGVNANHSETNVVEPDNAEDEEK